MAEEMPFSEAEARLSEQEAAEGKLIPLDEVISAE